ncbi:unnamed protein product [Lasius platythorax]|uniref:Uncharacterized protein n=1 Tax=Lasius platythorax TaxID=488582 RepID=A0AAV2NDK8_9HYME
MTCLCEARRLYLACNDPDFLTERAKHHGNDIEKIKSVYRYIDAFRYVRRMLPAVLNMERVVILVSRLGQHS